MLQSDREKENAQHLTTTCKAVGLQKDTTHYVPRCAWGTGRPVGMGNRAATIFPYRRVYKAYHHPINQLVNGKVSASGLINSVTPSLPNSPNGNVPTVKYIPQIFFSRRINSFHTTFHLKLAFVSETTWSVRSPITSIKVPHQQVKIIAQHGIAATAAPYHVRPIQ